MIINKITAAARTTVFALLAGAAALGLAGTAHAGPGGQSPTQSAPIYGNPIVAAAYWQHQNYDDCALMAVADVVGELTGRLPSEAQIISIAGSLASTQHSGPIYTLPADPSRPNETGNGTNPWDIDDLLAYFGIHGLATDTAHQSQTGVATGLDALTYDLAGGHKVIVTLNAEEIWGQPVQERTANGQPAADHAVVVTGVDLARGIVYLNDSGPTTGRAEQIPLNTFLQSWATSNDFMVVTNEAAA